MIFSVFSKTVLNNILKTQIPNKPNLFTVFKNCFILFYKKQGEHKKPVWFLICLVMKNKLNKENKTVLRTVVETT